MRRPTMEDVADAAGVSRSLVSLVMRDSDRVSDASRMKVLAAAEQLGYRPNLMARNLAQNRTFTLGLLLDDLYNPFYAEVAQGVWRAAAARGYQVMLNAGFRDPATHSKAINAFLDSRVDGVVLASPRSEATRLRAVAQTVPLVVIGERGDVTGTGVGTVTADDQLAASLVVGHLHALGHTDIAHVDGGSSWSAGSRSDAYRRAMKQRGLKEWIRVIPGDYTEEAGVAAANQLIALPTLPTAVFAANDLQATGLIGRLSELGLHVPTDISIVGYDNTSIAALHQVSLTTIDQNLGAMGELAANSLADHLDDAAEIAINHLLTPTLQVRTSTAAPRLHR